MMRTYKDYNNEKSNIIIIHIATKTLITSIVKERTCGLNRKEFTKPVTHSPRYTYMFVG